MPLVRVDSLAELSNFLKANKISNKSPVKDVFSFFCPTELEIRHAEVITEADVISAYEYDYINGQSFARHTYHTILSATCGNCRSTSIIFYYKTKTDERLVLIHPEESERADSPVHKEVLYYLSQARRSHSVGANSASVAMYRAALEQLLYHQGYQNGMLNAKIQKLSADIKNGTAPAWAKNLDTDYLEIIKELGNTSIHPNDGNIERQKAFDSDFVAALEITFAMILQKVFEAPAKEAGLKALLKAAVVRRQPPTPSDK